MKPNHKPSAFQMKVYAAISHIPRGKVATYGWVARQIGCRSAQAVGGALRVNPFAPKVPCHRVIGSNRSLTGFAGGVDKKAFLLEHERINHINLHQNINNQ